MTAAGEKTAGPQQPQHKGRGWAIVPYQWKKGQTGNAGGRPKGAVYQRRDLTLQFFHDLCASWHKFGQPALETAAMTSPIEYLRVVAQLMPRDVDVTVTKVNLERLSTSELRSLIGEYRSGDRISLEANRGADEVVEVDKAK